MLSGFNFGWHGAAIFAVCVWLFLVFTNKTPEVRTIKYFISALNDRGGHLLILLVLVIYFFEHSIGIFKWALTLRVAGKIEAEDAILLMALSFVTGSAFGGAASVFYKTMEAPNTRADASRSGVSPVLEGDGRKPPKPEDVSRPEAVVVPPAPANVSRTTGG